MTTIDNFNQGIFTVNSAGKVSVDFIYDGGGNRGEVAIFSLEGMENLEVGSAEFIQEAANRALSNSSQGYVVIQDESDRARFSDLKNEIDWEGDYNGGLYQGIQTFEMQSGTSFAMMLVGDGTVRELATNPLDTEVFFSFGSIDETTGEISPQIADLTGNGDTFGWEDVDFTEGDRDFNDLVLQVQGATTTAVLAEDYMYVNHNWLPTELGQEIIEYANRPQFETGTFEVNVTGQVQYEYLYDGGWFQGELAVFSLKGMEVYEYGSLEFLKEAANRALSNSTQGRILTSDTEDAPLFDFDVSWENNFNSGDYQGVKTFEMEAGDELAFMLSQNSTFDEIYANPSVTSQWGKDVIFSVDQDQLAAVDDNGTLGFEDVLVDSGYSDRDYNDFVFQVRGLDGDTVTMDDNVNPERDWRNTSDGVALLQYSDRYAFNEGVFTVGETGEMTFDFLYDGGWFQGELAVFSLSGMNNYEPGSEAFISEAVNRALSNSSLGYVLSSDSNDAARFSEKLSWENDFNAGEYQGISTFTMNPGEQFAFMLVQNTTVAEISDISKIYEWGKSPIFSIPEANPGGISQGQIVGVDSSGTYAFEDVKYGGDRDYNDFVFQVKGASGTTASIDDLYNPERDWRETTVGQELLEYANRAYFDQGIFQVGETGEVIIDYLYDGGWYEGELGIFSLDGMDIYETGSDAFVTEAINRALSNSNDGHVIVQDYIEGAKYSESFQWEGDFNQGNYLGKQTYTMTPGDTFGIVFIPGTTLEDALVAPDWATRKQPLFSMDDANPEDKVQIAEINSTATGSIIGFEDVRLERSSNQDYNDAVIAIEGATAINLADIDDVIHGNRNWLDGTTGDAISNYL